MSTKTQMSIYLKEKRKAANLSQGQVAQKLGYTTPQFVSNWERGLSLPPMHSLRELAGLYKINEEEMLEKIIEVTIDQVRADLVRNFKKSV